MVEEFFKSISIVFYEALCCGIFLNMFLEQRYPARWLKSLSVFLLTGVFLFWALITQTGGHYVFRSIGIIISIALFAVILYTGKWLLKIFLSFIFYAILFCVDYLGLILVDLLLDSADLSNSVIQVILVLLCKTVLFVIVLILDYFWKREKELDVKKSEWILMISFPMMTVVIMLVMLLSFQQKNNSFGYLTVSFGMVSINLVMFVLLKYISAREKQYNQMKILQERNKEKMQAYYEFSEDYAQKKRMVHDYNNQIHCIQGLLRQNKYREAEEYADKLTEILIDGREVIDVNNTVLNVVLNQKYRLAKSKDIALYFQVNDLSGLWMKEQDVVTFSRILLLLLNLSRKLWYMKDEENLAMIVKFVKYLIDKDVLDKQYEEDSIYGLTIMLEKIAAYVVLFCIAFIVRKPIEGIIFTVSFMAVRQTTGGFHAKSFLGCLTGSVLTLLMALEIIAPLIEKYEMVKGIIFILSTVCIWCFAPVNHPNLALSKCEQQEYKMWSRKVLGMEFGVIVIAYLLHMRWQQYMMIAIMFCAVFILIAKIVRQEVKCDEK